MSAGFGCFGKELEQLRCRKAWQTAEFLTARTSQKGTN
jgi:hypothetical protein